MPLFSRKSKRDEATEGDLDAEGKKKGAWKRPASELAVRAPAPTDSDRPSDTAFKQQRLKAWQPILTPKTVLPTLFLIGLIFAPIGGLLIWGSNKVSKITINYTNCDTEASSSFTNLSNYNYDLRSSDKGLPITPPLWSFVQDSTSNVTLRNHCRIRFTLPADLTPPVFLYYKLTNFYQNHRRYVKSFDKDQLRGKYRSAHDLDDGNCKPLGKIKVNGTYKAVYPCGLIANSLFNGAKPRVLGLCNGNLRFWRRHHPPTSSHQ